MRWDGLIKDIACISSFTIVFYLSPVFDAAVNNTYTIGGGFASAMNLAILLASGIWGICMVLMRSLKEKRRRRARFAFLFFTIVCLANATLFLWDFGVFDGSRVQFSEHLGKALFEALFIIATVIVLVKFNSPIDGAFTKICIGLIIVSVMPFATQAKAIKKAYVHIGVQGDIRFDFGDEEILDFSTEKNVLVFVLDAMQTDIFLTSYEQNKSIREAFQGFTCFRNNSGNAPNTTFAVPALISGIPYTGKIPKQEYMEKALLGPTSLPDIFKKNGYDVRMFTQHTIPYQPGIATWDNVKQEGEDKGGTITGWLALTRLAMYKVASMPFKLLLRDEKRFARINSFFVHNLGQAKPPLAARFDDAGLLDRLVKDLKKTNSAPVMRWFHLQGVHQPFTLISKKEQSELNMSVGQLSQLQADRHLKKFAEMLMALRERGVFNDATIVVLGDHGHGDTRMPVMLVKKAKGDPGFTINEAPTSNSDLPATLLSDAGIKALHEGRNMFDIDPGEKRERDFYEFFSVHNASGLPKKVTHQTLSKTRNIAANWTITSTYHPALLGREDNTEYMGFTLKDEVDPDKVRGDYRRGNAGITWSEWLEVDIPTPGGCPALVELVYYRYKPTPERVKIFVDGTLTAEKPTASFGTLHFFLPAKAAEAENRDKSLVRFTFQSNKKEEDTLLFVDLLFTKLRSTLETTLKPENTWMNCKKKAVLGTGGEFWGEAKRIMAVVDGALVTVTVNVEKKMYSFKIPDDKFVTPFEYHLVDATTGTRGPEVTIEKKCP